MKNLLLIVVIISLFGGVSLYNISQKQIDTLQIIFEDLKNHLTIIGGFVQISSKNTALMHTNIIKDSIVKSDFLIEQAISILNEMK